MSRSLPSTCHLRCSDTLRTESFRISWNIQYCDWINAPAPAPAMSEPPDRPPIIVIMPPSALFWNVASGSTPPLEIEKSEEPNPDPKPDPYDDPYEDPYGDPYEDP